MKGYKCFTKNSQHAALGSIASCIKEKYDDPETFQISEGVKEEFIITRYWQFKLVNNVANFYGDQESQLTSDKIGEN